MGLVLPTHWKQQQTLPFYYIHKPQICVGMNTQ